MTNLQEFRDFYAKLIVARASSSDERLIKAFATVERECFVGKGPWSVFTPLGYIQTMTDDPRLLYQDLLIGLAADRGINNGQPSLHASCLATVNPSIGETVTHVGAGTGYYSAVLAHLVGPSGTVHAYEIEQDMAALAAANLSAWPNVKVHCTSACDIALPKADVIYVNAGATDPMANWLDALQPGGRLIFPLTSDEGPGSMLFVTYKGSSLYAAKLLGKVQFIPCIGARNDTMSKTLAAAFESRNINEVQSLQRNSDPDETAWCVGTDWWLSTTAVD